MKLSVKSDYAARAVLGLARHFPAGSVLRIEELATGQHIPPKYLVQILIELKAQGIVKSVRGKEGGYLLGRAPAEITFGDVLRAVHGEVFDAPALADPNCPAELRRSWQRLKGAVDAAANQTTFQQLLDEGAEKEKMYYI
ncbi:MAG: Rrf2 family transcriptional regulator [Verrucomicrobiota bacterium]